jgi:hypothetical protein
MAFVIRPLTTRAVPAYLTQHETERLAPLAGRTRVPPTPRVNEGASQTRGAAAAIRIVVLTALFVGMAARV